MSNTISSGPWFVPRVLLAWLKLQSNHIKLLHPLLHLMTWGKCPVKIPALWWLMMYSQSWLLCAVRKVNWEQNVMKSGFSLAALAVPAFTLFVPALLVLLSRYILFVTTFPPPLRPPKSPSKQTSKRNGHLALWAGARGVLSRGVHPEGRNANGDGCLCLSVLISLSSGMPNHSASIQVHTAPGFGRGCLCHSGWYWVLQRNWVVFLC